MVFLIVLGRIESFLVFVAVFLATRTHTFRHILETMFVQRTPERIQTQFEESSSRRQRFRVVVDFVNLFPVIHFRYQFMSRPSAEQMLEFLLQEETTVRILDVGNFLFVESQIRFHIHVTLFRLVDVELYQRSQHIVVQTNQFAVGRNFIEEFHFGGAPALVDLWVCLNGIDVQLSGVQLIGIERPTLTVGDYSLC